MEFSQKTNHHINIVPTSNGGFVVNAGCCTRSYTDTASLLSDLKDFLNDPKEVESQYNKFNNNFHNCNLPETCDPMPTAGRIG